MVASFPVLRNFHLYSITSTLACSFKHVQELFQADDLNPQRFSLLQL